MIILWALLIGGFIALYVGNTVFRHMIHLVAIWTLQGLLATVRWVDCHTCKQIQAPAKPRKMPKPLPVRQPIRPPLPPAPPVQPEPSKARLKEAKIPEVRTSKTVDGTTVVEVSEAQVNEWLAKNPDLKIEERA